MVRKVKEGDSKDKSSDGHPGMVPMKEGNIDPIQHVPKPSPDKNDSKDHSKIL